MRLFRVAIVALISCCVLASCRPSPQYQKTEVVPGHGWTYSFKPTFVFEITDTDAVYQPYFIIRHTEAYPYNNIWMWLYIKTPRDTVATKARINITLAEASGKWLGRGMGEIYEQRMPISLGDSVNMSVAGTYEVVMEQNMRINPLPEILDVGLRVEKATVKK